MVFIILDYCHYHIMTLLNMFACSNKNYYTFEKAGIYDSAIYIAGCFIYSIWRNQNSAVLAWSILCLYFTLEEGLYSWLSYSSCLCAYSIWHLKNAEINGMCVEKMSPLGGIHLFLPTYYSLPPASDKKRIDCINLAFLHLIILKKKVLLLLYKYFIWIIDSIIWWT